MIFAMLLPLVWALAGLVAVTVLSDHRSPRTTDTPRIDVRGCGDLRPAA